MKSAIAITLMATFVSACGGGKDGNSSTVRVGLIAPRGTPPYQSVTGAILLAKDMVDKAGGLLGGKLVEFVERDEQNLGMDPTTGSAIAACESLIDDDVKVIMGPFTSPNALACAPITGAANVLQMSAVAGTDALSTVADNDFTFRIAVRTGYVTGVTAQYLYNREGARRAAVLALDNIDNVDEGNGFANAFRALGGSVVVETYTYSPTSFNAQAHLNAVFASNPDVIFMSGLPPDAVALLQTWNRSDFSGKWVLGTGLLAPTLATNVGGEKMQGIRVAAQHADLGAPFLNLSLAYNQLNGFSIEQYSPAINVVTFEAMLLLELAIQAAGTADDGVAIRDGLRAVASAPGVKVSFGDLETTLGILAGGGDIDYDGISSTMTFDANGDVLADIDFYVFGTQTLTIERTLVAGVDFDPATL